MPDLLRTISIHVEEPRAGSFEWVLAERRPGGAWTELSRAEAPAGTFRQSMAEGLQALEAMVDDLDAGPRRADSGTPGDKHRKAKPHGEGDGDEPEPEPPPRTSMFGFGPVR